MTTDPRPTVYITQAGMHDYTPASEYGTLEPLAHGELTFDAEGVVNRSILMTIADKLRRYVPGRDYLLLAGSPLTIAWVCLLLSEFETSGHEHKFLKWDAYTRRYRVYEITTPIYKSLAA